MPPPATAYLHREHMGVEIDDDKLSVVLNSENYENSVIASTAQQPLERMTAHHSDLTNADSKIPNHFFDESGRSRTKKACFCKFSRAVSNNTPLANPGTHFLAKLIN
ncbi:unnamed protein product [Heterobilharzia americana]|nr:unnamed protein product [Heterobilharzia americana]